MHRRPLLDALERYLARHPDERVAVDHVRQFVRANPDCFERTCRDGHVTGSAWIVSADRQHVLLTHHRKLDRWLQLGGHADGDPDPLRVALREAREESGIDGLLPLSSEPLDVDVHPIPAHGDDPPHLHHDVRFLLVAPPGAVARVSDESHALRWIARADLAAFVTEESVLRMERKSVPLLDGREGSVVRNPTMEETPDLLAVWDAITGYQRTAAVKAGVELDVFTAIGAGATTVPELAKRCKTAERGMRVLCDRLVTDRLLTKDGDRYGLAATAAAFLDRSSPAFLGSAATFVASPTIMAGFASFTEAVRRGGTAIAENVTGPEHPVWVEFARAMAPLARLTATLLANVLDAANAPRWHVLDVAAGHGMYGIAVAQANRQAEITALDWRNVLAVAEENARAAGVGDRLRLLPGSAFDVELGTGYDLVLVTNFLHHFDAPTCTRFLARVRAALAPKGRVAIVEFVPNDDRVTPPEAAAFAAVMLASTPSGDAYTYAEIQAMCRDAGFARTERHDLQPSPQTAIIGSVA